MAQVAAEVRPLPMRLVLHLVNEWGDVPREEAHGSTRPYPGVDSFWSAVGGDWQRVPGVDERMLIEVANLVHPVFAADSGSACAERLNALIDAADLTLTVANDEWQVREVWRSRSANALLAAAALSLIEHLRMDPDGRRLGTCEGSKCADAYVDHSPTGRRQYCCLTCQNRARARAYRAKKKQLASSDRHSS